MQFTQFGSTYGQGTYGCGPYGDGSSACASTGASSGGQSGGSVLSNTGFDIALVVTLACVIALAAVLVRFWKRPANSSQN